jgi:hypothetical protein
MVRYLTDFCTVLSLIHTTGQKDYLKLTYGLPV